MNGVEIVTGSSLRETQKQKVAEIFYDSFIKKFSRLWLFANSAQQGVQCLRQCINYESGLYAVNNGTVLGFVGLEWGKGNYTDLKFNSLNKVFGFSGAIWRYLAYKIFRLFHHHVNENGVHIDPIAVSQEARGKGIGSMLLNASFEYAKAMGKRKIVLEVVDTNPDAQKLYERTGFVVTKKEHLAMLTSKAGFTEVIHMSKDL